MWFSRPASGPEADCYCSRPLWAEIDLLLADVDMPGMSGHETALQICAQRPQLKVLYMSGCEPPAQKTGEATVFFKKPFTSSALLEKLREILRQRFPSSKKSDKESERNHDHSGSHFASDSSRSKEPIS